MTNAEIINAMNALGTPTGQELCKHRLPGKVAVTLARNRRKLAAAYTEYREILVELLDRYDLTLDGLKNADLPPEAQEEIKALLEQDEPVDIRTVSIDEYEGMTVEEIELLAFMTEDEET